MKKFFSVLSAVSLTVSLAACSPAANNAKTNQYRPTNIGPNNPTGYVTSYNKYTYYTNSGTSRGRYETYRNGVVKDHSHPRRTGVLRDTRDGVLRSQGMYDRGVNNYGQRVYGTGNMNPSSGSIYGYDGYASLHNYNMYNTYGARTNMYGTTGTYGANRNYGINSGIYGTAGNYGANAYGYGTGGKYGTSTYGYGTTGTNVHQYSMYKPYTQGNQPSIGYVHLSKVQNRNAVNKGTTVQSNMSQTQTNRNMAVQNVYVDREMLASAIAKVAKQMPGIEDVTSLVTDNQAFVGCDTSGLRPADAQKALEKVQKGCENVCPRYYKVYTTNDKKIITKVQAHVAQLGTKTDSQFEQMIGHKANNMHNLSTNNESNKSSSSKASTTHKHHTHHTSEQHMNK
jgi:hypothetical protein